MLTALLIVARATHIAASVLIAGTFTFEVVTLGLATPAISDDFRAIERRLLRLAIWSLVAALFSGVLWFWLEVVNMGDFSFVNAFSARAWQKVLLQTEFGHVWALRLGLIAIAFVFAISLPARNETRRPPVILVVWLMSVVVLVSLAWISHAAAARVQPLGKWADALHLCAAGGWIGGLVPLTIFFARAQLSFSLREKILQVLDRYTVQSLCCVSVLVVSGICNSWLLIGSIHALFTTVYGWLLLFKLAVFAILLGFGARNLLAIKAERLRTRIARDLLPQLHCNVICEVCLGAAVLAIVACLGVTPPAGHP
jgi:copper resistance protein D